MYLLQGAALVAVSKLQSISILSVSKLIFPLMDADGHKDRTLHADVFNPNRSLEVNDAGGIIAQ